MFSVSELEAVNEYVHVGTNSIHLTAGLEFDEMFLTILLDSAVKSCPATLPGEDPEPCEDEGSPISTTLSGLLPIFGAPDQNPYYDSGISYIETTPVPLPAAAWLLLSGLGGLGLVGRRRKAV